LFFPSTLANTRKGCTGVLMTRCKGHDPALAVIRGPISAELFSQLPGTDKMPYNCELELRAKDASGRSNPHDYLYSKYPGEHSLYFEYEGADSDDFFHNAVKSWNDGYYKTRSGLPVQLYQPYGFGCAGVLNGQKSKVACVFGASLNKN
ncbi:hypothetical protein Y032_0659g1258, partial [Ancylostoma ceylanicum]